MSINNIFINSGIRGKTDHNLIHPEYMFALGSALGLFITKEQKIANVLIATDTRPSGAWIKDKLIQGLIKQNVQLFDAGIVPTPCIAKAIKDYRQQNFHLGIMITASHNPAEYNGLKIIMPSGYLTEEQELAISELFYQILQHNTNNQTILGYCQTIDLIPFYTQIIQEQLIHKNYAHTSVLLDCAHGATVPVAKDIFDSLGFKTIVINNSVNGSLINKNSGCSDPSLLIHMIKQYHTTWGCAFDGDGDRIIIAHENGRIFDGDDILIYLSKHPQFQKDSTFIGTIMNNLATENYLHTQQKRLIRTPVGEKHLINALKEHKAHLASEPCGHITIAQHALCSDGIFAALMFFDTMYADQQNTDISYIKFTQLHKTINLAEKNISEIELEKIIKQNQKLLQPGRMVIRKSNTEPLLRIMIEHEDKTYAEQMLETISFLCSEQLT